MMRGVGGKAGSLFETALEPFEGRVEHFDQFCDLVVSRRNRETLVEPLRGDPVCGLPDLLDWRDSLACHPGRTNQGHKEHRRNCAQHRQENVAANLIDLLEIVTSAQGETILTELSHTNFLAAHFLVVKFFDAIARERMAQSWRQINHGAVGGSYFRSEERRVGKECRSRGSP